VALGAWENATAFDSSPTRRAALYAPKFSPEVAAQTPDSTRARVSGDLRVFETGALVEACLISVQFAWGAARGKGAYYQVLFFHLNVSIRVSALGSDLRGRE
jgi:hypothetical protein